MARRRSCTSRSWLVLFFAGLSRVSVNAKHAHQAPTTLSLPSAHHRRNTRRKPGPRRRNSFFAALLIPVRTTARITDAPSSHGKRASGLQFVIMLASPLFIFLRAAAHSPSCSVSNSVVSCSHTFVSRCWRLCRCVEVCVCVSACDGRGGHVVSLRATHRRLR